MPRDFDGVDDRVDPGTTAYLDNLPAFTWTCWMKADTLGEGNLGSMLQKGNSSTPAKRFFLEANNVIRMIIRGDGNSESVNDSITLGVWTFIAITYDEAGDGKARIYVGISPSKVDEVSYATQVAETAPNTEATSSFLIGSLSGGQRAFDGQLAFATIHNRILSLSELRMLAAFPGSITNGLVGHWPLWSKGTASEPDLSGRGLTGVVTGALPIFYDGPPVLGIFKPNRVGYPSYVAPGAPAPAAPAAVVAGRRLTRMMMGVGL